MNRSMERIISRCETLPHAITLSKVAGGRASLRYCNAMFEVLVGYELDQIKGLDCRFLQGKGTDPEAALKLDCCIQTLTAGSAVLLNYRKDGTAFMNLICLEPIRMKMDETYMLGLQYDFSPKVAEIAGSIGVLSAEATARLQRAQSITAHYRKEAMQMQAQASAAVLRMLVNRP